MSEAILDAFRHNGWATRVLIEFCRGLDEKQLASSAPGIYGNILETLQHLITGESGYTAWFTGAPLPWDVQGAPLAALDELEVRSTEVEATWEKVLSGGVDGDDALKRTRSDGSIAEMRAGVMLAQALHHSNVHREQISAVLTGLGLTPPDVSAWAYGRESGRYRRV